MLSARENCRQEKAGPVRRFRSVPDVHIVTAQDAGCANEFVEFVDNEFVEFVDGCVSEIGATEDPGKDVASYTSEQWKAYRELEQVDMINEVKRLEKALEEERRRAEEERKWSNRLQERFAVELQAQREANTRNVRDLEEQNRRLSNQVEQLLHHITSTSGKPFDLTALKSPSTNSGAMDSSCDPSRTETSRNCNASHGSRSPYSPNSLSETILVSTTELVPLSSTSSPSTPRSPRRESVCNRFLRESMSATDAAECFIREMDSRCNSYAKQLHEDSGDMESETRSSVAPASAAEMIYEPRHGYGQR